jgi:hypothetical protein
MYKKQKKLFKKTYIVLPVVCLHLIVPECKMPIPNLGTECSSLTLKLVIAGRPSYPFHYPGTWTETLSAYRWRLKVRNG